MFKSKYIFETKQTRLQRYLKNFMFILVVGFILYSILSVIFILVSENASKSSLERFFNRPPDLIAVFTGDAGRIPFALKKAQEYKQPHIFITGVYSKNNVDTLLTPLKVEEKINPDMLQIDYLARNTLENCISTLRYLRENKVYKNILIISHDYHIMRIKLIMNNIIQPGEDFEFHYSGIKTTYSNWRNLKILYTEVFKLLRTYGFLMFWDSQENSRVRRELLK